MTHITNESVSLGGINPNSSSILACGADIKNRFSIYHEGRLYVSGDNGNLSDPVQFKKYIDAVQFFCKDHAFVPARIALDKHPYYFSGQAADLFPGVPRVLVQHHYAHIAAFLAYTDKVRNVIGVSFDGTGYGDDGTLWGGEFFLVSGHSYKRVGTFRQLKMPGGEKAIHEPWRMAFSLLHEYYGERILKMPLEPLRRSHSTEQNVLMQALARDINMPLTSSCGRLFDAVASLADLVHVASFEAEGPIALEKKAAASNDQGEYHFTIESSFAGYTIQHQPFLDEICRDIQARVQLETIARRFHNGMALLVKEMVQKISPQGIPDTTVVFSGGVFQNKLLYNRSVCLLKEAGYNVLEIPGLPLNDLNICVGQTYAASYAQERI